MAKMGFCLRNQVILFPCNLYVRFEQFGKNAKRQLLFGLFEAAQLPFRFKE